MSTFSDAVVKSQSEVARKRDHFNLVIGKRVREVRLEAKLQLCELARLCHVTTASMHALEDGRSISLYLLALVAHHLDVMLDELVPVDAIGDT